MTMSKGATSLNVSLPKKMRLTMLLRSHANASHEAAARKPKPTDAYNRVPRGDFRSATDVQQTFGTWIESEPPLDTRTMLCG